MNKTGAGILAFAILVTLIVGSGSRPGSSATPAGILHPQAATARSSSKSRTRQSPALAACEITEGTFKFDLVDAVRRSVSRDPVEDGKECAEKFAVKDQEIKKGLHVFFAIVPDPVHTDLSLFFDRQLDAIQQGIIDSGWSFERALMPWDNKEHPESDDFHIRIDQKIYQDDQEDQPGLMIFRHTRSANDKDADLITPPGRLLVFVISESPTAGVQRVQFRQAVNLVQQFFGENTPDHLPIFGPTFTGSLQSLVELLNADWPQDFFCTAKKSVYSGTVTGFSQTSRFKDITDAPFVSLQENDEYVLRVFVDFARKAWRYSNDRIAVLSEDETPYGKGPKNDPYQQRHGKTPAPSSSNVAPVIETPPGPGETRCSNSRKKSDASKIVSSSAEPSGLVQIFFPRGISQLRSAYQHSLNTPAGGGKAPRTTLPLDLESRGSDDYAAPEYSGKQYPLSQEAVLLGVVRELRQHRAQIILLRATDPLDLLFLSRYLRQAYPDGRIITVSSDLLFARELEDAGLHGVMALTTYPLTFGADPELRHHTREEEGRIFPSTHSVGSYNAVKLLMAENEMSEPEEGCSVESSDKPCVHLFQYRWPEVTSSSPVHPPVYLTVLGHEGYWPVTPLALADGSDGSANGPNNTLPDVIDPQRPTKNALGRNSQNGETGISFESPPAGWSLFWIAAILVSLAYAYFIWSASILSSSQAVAQLAPSRRDSRRYLVALAAYLHFAVLMALLWLYEYQLRTSSSWPKFFLIGALVLVVVVGTRDLYRRNCSSLAILLLVATVLTPLLLWLTLKDDPFHEMSYYRSMHLASGVSDLLSVMLFLAAGLWAVWYSLSGSSLLDSSRTQLPKRKEIETTRLEDRVKKRLQSFRGIMEEDQERLTRVIKPDYVHRRALLLSMIVVVVLLLYSRLRPLRTFEPITHEYVLAGLAACSFAFLIAGAVRLHTIWIELRRLLTSLDTIPLRHGFRRLKEFSWSPLWRPGAGNLGGFRRIITLQAEALRCAFNLNVPAVGAFADDFNKQAEETQKKYEDALNQYMANGGAGATGAEADSKRSFSPLRVFQRWLINVQKQVDKDNLLLDQFEKLQQKFATAGLHALAFAVTEWDSSTTVAYGELDDSQSSKTAVRADTPKEKEVEKQSEMRDAAERFLALLYTSFIMIVLIRIRTLIMTVGGMYVLCLLALTTYPFQPQVEIKVFLLLMLVFMIALVGTVYAQMHRDATLINITSIEPGQLRLSFWLRMTSFIALPVFSLVASQYPEIGSVLYSWLEPALNALR